MAVTISQLFTRKTGAPQVSLAQGQILVSIPATTPQIWLSQASAVQPCWVSETEPAFGAGQGSLWYKPSESQLLVAVGSEYKPVWAGLIGSTDATRCSLGAWEGGLLKADGPQYMTCITNRNPTSTTLSASKSVLINTAGSDYPFELDDKDKEYVLINGGGNYGGRTPQAGVSIGSAYGGSGGAGSVRIGARSGQNRGTIDNTFTVVGVDSLRDLHGDYFAITSIGYESGRDFNPVQPNATATLLDGPQTPFDSARGGYRKSDSSTFIGTRGTIPPLLGELSECLAIGSGCLPGRGSTVIGINQSTTSTGNVVVTNGTFTHLWSTNSVVMGGSANSNVGLYGVVLSNGLGQVMLYTGDGALTFKDNKPVGIGRVLVSGGTTNCPQWVDVLKTYTFSSSDRKIVTITNGLVTSIE